MLRSDAVERAIYKDIPQVFGVENPIVLERLLYVLAGRMTGILSPAGIFRSWAVSRNRRSTSTCPTSNAPTSRVHAAELLRQRGRDPETRAEALLRRRRRPQRGAASRPRSRKRTRQVTSSRTSWRVTSTRSPNRRGIDCFTGVRTTTKSTSSSTIRPRRGLRGRVERSTHPQRIARAPAATSALPRCFVVVPGLRARAVRHGEGRNRDAPSRSAAGRRGTARRSRAARAHGFLRTFAASARGDVGVSFGRGGLAHRFERSLRARELDARLRGRRREPRVRRGAGPHGAPAELLPLDREPLPRPRPRDGARARVRRRDGRASLPRARGARRRRRRERRAPAPARGSPRRPRARRARRPARRLARARRPRRGRRDRARRARALRGRRRVRRAREGAPRSGRRARAQGAGAVAPLRPDGRGVGALPAVRRGALRCAARARGLSRRSRCGR